MAKPKKKDCSEFVEQGEKIREKDKFQIREFPWTLKQKEFIEAVQKKETNVVFVNAPAGVGKTLLAVYCGLQSLNNQKTSQIMFLRNPVESSDYGLGFIPGDEKMKMAVYLGALQDKLSELLQKSCVEKLLAGNYIDGLPIGYVRGLSFRSTFIICDEAQCMSRKDLLLVLSRLGKFSKILIIGDESQTDIKRSGFKQVFDAFSTEEAKKHGILTFTFDKSDIMRNEILSFVIDTFDKLPKS